MSTTGHFVPTAGHFESTAGHSVFKGGQAVFTVGHIVSQLLGHCVSIGHEVLPTGHFVG